MKKTWCVLLSTILFLCTIFTSSQIIMVKAKTENDSGLEKIYCQATIDDNFAEDRVLLVLQKGEQIVFRDYTVSDFSSVNCVSVEELTSGRTQKVRDGVQGVDGNYNRILKLSLAKKSKQNVLKAMEILMQREDVLQASPDFIFEMDNSLENIDGNVNINNRAVGPLPGIDENARWELRSINLIRDQGVECSYFTVGSKEIKVGVIDNGIDNDHPAFGNGANSNISTIGFPSAIDAYTPTGFHGTFIAGIIGAKDATDVGVCEEVEIISLKYPDNFSQTSISQIGEAIRYATEQDIPIINLSSAWGFANAEIRNATLALLGIFASYTGLVVCCAGNNGLNIDEEVVYPACFDLDNIIVVGGIDKFDERAINNDEQGNTQDNASKESNYGANNVDIYAPGLQVYSTKINGVYDNDSGTSFAAPYVTGVAALLMSIKIDLTAVQLKNAILNSATLITIEVGNGTDQQVRKLNAFNAIKYVFENYGTTVNTTGGTVVCQKYLDSASTIYNEKTQMVKVNVVESGTYSIMASSTSAMSVKLFGEDLNDIPITLTETDGGCILTFEGYLNAGVYYIETKYVSTTATGAVALSVTGV